MDRPVGKHGFNSGNERTHRPELQYLRPPRIGGGEPTDRAASARTKGQREAQAALVRGLMERRENHSRLGNRKVTFRADSPDTVHPAHREEHGAAVRGRCRPGNHARIAALGHQRNAIFRRERYKLGDFGR